MLRVGVVSEGVSDFLILREVMRQVRPEAEFVHLHPSDTSALLGQGWKGVRGWCIRHRDVFETLMAQHPGGPVHLLVIHLDCSMADKVAADRPCPPASATAEALRAVVHAQWMPPHPAVLIATPAMTTDTWVVATLDPPRIDVATIECNRAAEDELTRSLWGPIKRLRSKDGAMKKPRSAYEPFAALVGPNLDRVAARCSQAEAFRLAFAEAAGQVVPPADLA